MFQLPPISTLTLYVVHCTDRLQTYLQFTWNAEPGGQNMHQTRQSDCRLCSKSCH